MMDINPYARSAAVDRPVRAPIEAGAPWKWRPIRLLSPTLRVWNDSCKEPRVRGLAYNY